MSKFIKHHVYVPGTNDTMFIVGPDKDKVVSMARKCFPNKILKGCSYKRDGMKDTFTIRPKLKLFKRKG